MVATLPVPEVLRSYFEEASGPGLPAVCLQWPAAGEEALSQLWRLPEDVCFHGPPPRHFGIQLQRQADDCYAVELLWNRTRLSWSGLAREQLLGSDLAPLLAALGTDLWCLLDPTPASDGAPPRAA